MAFLLRYRISVAVVLVAVCALGGVFLFARPEYRPPHQGESIEIPAKQPAADAASAAGWRWPDGVPGWEPGQMIGDFPVSGLQAVEVQPVALSAARSMLDASRLRVVIAEHLRPGDGPLAIFAAPLYDATPLTACLGVTLPTRQAVRWLCPRQIGSSPVVLGVQVLAWEGPKGTQGTQSLNLAGVARGDVSRVVLHVPWQKPWNWELYRRGTTWGQFQANLGAAHAGAPAVLRVYGDHGRLLRSIRLALKPGEARIYP